MPDGKSANDLVQRTVREGLTLAQHWFLEGVLYQLRSEADNARWHWEQAQKNFNMLMWPEEREEYDRAKERYEGSQAPILRAEIYWTVTFKQQNEERNVNSRNDKGEDS